MTYIDTPFEGNYDQLTCPYCYETVHEVWDYGLKLYAEDDEDSLECHHCNERFIVTKLPHDYPLQSRQMHDGFKDARAKHELQLADYSKELSRHFLYQVVDTVDVQAYYLKRPGGSRCMSTYIMFTPEGIMITGDLCPHYGVVSNHGYGVGWFSGQLSPSYLCKKFMMVDELTPAHSLLIAIQQQFAKAYSELSLEMALD